MPQLADPGVGCGCCTDGEEIWSVDYDGQDGCKDDSTIAYVNACSSYIYWYFDSHTTGDGFTINDFDAGCCDDVFNSACEDGAEGTLDIVEDLGTVELDIEVVGCCAQGSRRSSYEGYIDVFCL